MCRGALQGRTGRGWCLHAQERPQEEPDGPHLVSGLQPAASLLSKSPAWDFVIELGRLTQDQCALLHVILSVFKTGLHVLGHGSMGAVVTV